MWDELCRSTFPYKGALLKKMRCLASAKEALSLTWISTLNCATNCWFWLSLTPVYCEIHSIHNLLTSSQSTGPEQDKMPTQNGTQPQPPLHQRPPPPRNAISEGVSLTRFQRSDSAPPYPQQSSTTMMGSLVVNLGRQTNLVENRNIAQGPAERSRFPPTSPLPPPPAPKSVGLRFSSVMSRNLPCGVCVCVWTSHPFFFLGSFSWPFFDCEILSIVA